jgi:ABC-type oligopeptide transport system substrate-binding subunit
VRPEFAQTALFRSEQSEFHAVLRILDKNTLRIAVDALPYEKSLHRISDYSGAQIYSKLALPLFRERGESIECLAANSYKWSSDALTLRVTLRNDLFWTNGEQVTAHHYIRGLKHVCRDVGNRFRTVLSDVCGFSDFASSKCDRIGIEALSENELLFSLKNRSRYFLYYLTLIVLSPLHATDNGQTAGPYYMYHRSKKSVSLKVNTHYNIDRSHERFEEIVFCEYDRQQDIAAFKNKEVDVSCDTTLSYDRYPEMRYDHCFHRETSGLIALLSMGTLSASLPGYVKSLIASAIDRNAICEQLHNLPRPAYSYTDIYSNHTDELSTVIAPKPLKSLFRATVAFENFYPNRVILDLISKQLKFFRITLIPVEEPYGNREATTHLRFEIRCSTAHTPILFYQSDVLNSALPVSAIKRARTLYSAVIQEQGSLREIDYYRNLDRLLQEAAVAIPLVILPRGTFVRPDIDKSSIFNVGAYITRKN